MDIVQSLTRNSRIGYHLAEAESWLAASGGGAHSTPLAYAAFELRLETERIALELVVRIRGSTLAPTDLAAIREFKKIENRIYELEGHQLTLNRKIALINATLEALEIDWRVQSINLGSLRDGWHKCSDLCHVTFSLLADSTESARIVADAYQNLCGIQRYLREIVDGGISWPQIADSAFVDLQARYVRGDIDDEAVRSWFKGRGLWAQKLLPDGSMHFEGVAIPPPAG